MLRNTLISPTRNGFISPSALFLFRLFVFSSRTYGELPSPTFRPRRKINDQSHPATFISCNHPRLAGLLAATFRLLLSTLFLPSFILFSTIQDFRPTVPSMETQDFIAQRKLLLVRIRLLIERKSYLRAGREGSKR